MKPHAQTIQTLPPYQLFSAQNTPPNELKENPNPINALPQTILFFQKRTKAPSPHTPASPTKIPANELISLPHSVKHHKLCINFAAPSNLNHPLTIPPYPARIPHRKTGAHYGHHHRHQ